MPWLALVLAAAAQEPSDSIAFVEAEVAGGELVLTFSDRDFKATTIQRREYGATESWLRAETVAELEGETEWSDPEVLPGETWEYKVVRDKSATGYIAASLEGDLVDARGTVALIIEESVAEPLSEEIERLVGDLVGDGWTVEQFEVSADDEPPDVKALYTSIEDIEAVLLLGHVPVPYSGNIYPDGHTDHRGAWPADTYYADLDGTWTDSSVDTTSASREANHNVPGDGKFDPSTVPSDVELQVGRVDLSDLPSFDLDEVELLRRYLDRDHAWRQAEIEVIESVVIDDNFGTYAPASYSAWLLSPVVDRDHLEEGDFSTTLGKQPYLFGFGSGGGSYTSCSGVASTSTFASTEVRGVFLMLFGSYFGDWDYTDALLRAAIAGEGNALTSVWAGRPIHLHHALGAGDTIGAAVRMTTNSSERLTGDSSPGGVHIALHGDPTLRAYPLAPPGALSAESTDSQGTVTLSWEASPDDVLGYHVYRATGEHGPYDRITEEPVEGDVTDVVPAGGEWWWMVRAVVLLETPSGSFYDASQGTFASLVIDCDGDCGSADTGSWDTGSWDTGSWDTGAEDTGSGEGPQGGEDKGCGCNGGGPVAPWALLALPILLRRRVRPG